MSVSCASRFSVLKIEDDDYDSDSSDGGLKQKKLDDTKAISNVQEKKSSKKKKKKIINKECPGLPPQTVASEGPPKHKSKPSKASEKQWEEWVQRDAGFVSDAFEADLQKALLLSKLDFEEKKELYEVLKVEEETGSTKKKKKNNQQQKKLMSLEDFNNIPPEASSLSRDEPPKPLDNCAHFFDEINEATLDIISKENRSKKTSARKVETTVRGGAGETSNGSCEDGAAGFEMEKVRTIEYEDRLKEKDKEIEALRQEVETLKEELKECKSRKKQLCKLMYEGEMRDKAVLLVQVDQLNKVKDDLTEQFTELHAALEQERSKVHQLQNELKKNQGKRRDERKNSQKDS